MKSYDPIYDGIKEKLKYISNYTQEKTTSR